MSNQMRFNKMPTNLWGGQNAAPLKAIGGGIFGRFSNFDESRLEVVGDAISDKLMGPDVPENRAKFSDPRFSLRLNRSLEIFDDFFSL